jgi:hypothetical protein
VHVPNNKIHKQEQVMRNQANVAMEQRRAISRLAHVVERVGLAVAGTLCGLFVGADVIRAHAAFESIGFIMMMCLIGTAGFYLGIDVPRNRAIDLRNRGLAVGVNPVEWLSATGTLLTAMAALVSVTSIVLDEAPQSTVTILVGCGWLVGATLQIGAGAMARLRAIHQPSKRSPAGQGER